MAKASGIKFNVVYRHGDVLFVPGTVYAFADADAAPFFVAAGVAEKVGDAPHVTLPKSAIDIDPETTFGNGDRLGQKVLGG